jgi:ergothioneine biosynthesis protein EgtB
MLGLRTVPQANLSTPTTEVAERLRSTRRRTLALCGPLSPEDMMVQSCPEASPAKWHLAHTAWFFESFVLREFLPGYRLFDSDFTWLFNSYYQSFAAFPEKRLRSSFSRPSLDQILRFRGYVDGALEHLFSRNLHPEAHRRIELGVNHEEQHQELILTDILHAFFTNPLRPAYKPANALADSRGGSPHPDAPALRFIPFEGGMQEVGASGEGFSFDNEQARHRVWLEPFTLASRLVTCGEFAAFIADGGYRRPELWLSAGWDAVQSRGWRAPLYWCESDGRWTVFTLLGEQPLSALKAAPVSHVSFYEADAFARWAGRRLPTEFEWETAAKDLAVEGNLLDSDRLQPASAADTDLFETPAQRQRRSQRQLFEVPAEPGAGPTQLFGDCWEWTASAYLPYPGFKPLSGSLGEYNGKFMSGQMVLRGGSCLTPQAHVRPTYRNFFPPETRWQFSGIRLAS